MSTKKTNQTSEETEETPTSEETEDEKTSKENASKEDESTSKEEESTEVDYKQKFSDSKQEGIRLLHANQELEKRQTELETKLVDKANEAPSDEELSKEIPEWDSMTDGEKVILKRQTKLDKDLRLMKEKEAWTDDLAEAKSWAKENDYSLSGTEFKKFCYAEENRGIKNIVTLTKSFLFDKEKNKKEPSRVGLESPTGGGKASVKGGKLTAQEAKRLRTTDYKAYKKAVIEGRIKASNIQE